MTYLISAQYKMDCFFVCLLTLWMVTGGTVPLSVSFSFWVNGLVCYGSWVWVHLLVLQEHQNTIKLHVSLELRSDEELQHLGEERKREEKVGWDAWTNDALLSHLVKIWIQSEETEDEDLQQEEEQSCSAPNIHPHWSSECTWRSEPWQPRTRAAADWTINNCFASRCESVCSACEHLPTHCNELISRVFPLGRLCSQPAQERWWFSWFCA